MRRWLLLIVVAVALLFQCVTTTALREYFVGDEGFYGTVALNMERSWYYWLHPTQVPEGSFESERARLGHPCIHCMFMAASSKLLGGGIVPFQLVPLASFALTLYFLYRLVSLWDEQAGRYAVYLAAISPVMLSEFSLLQAEPMMAALGLAGICFAASGVLHTKGWCARVAGLCFGLAFLSKLWLSFPYPFAGGVAVIILSRLKKQPLAWLLRYLVLMLGYFLLTSSLHLLAIAIWAPEDLPFWVKGIYCGLFSGQGVQGTKLQGDSLDLPANWAHPFWYYFGIAYRDHFFVFPIIALGLPYLSRRVYPALSWIAPGIASILLLSVFAIKSSLYVLSVMLFIYALAGLCLVALLRQKEFRWSVWTGIVALLLSLLLIGVLVAPSKLSTTYRVAHTLVVGLFFWLMTAFNPYRRAKTIFLYASAVLFALFIVTDLSARYPTDQVLSAMIAPYVEHKPPNQVAFIAPNFKSPQLYLFRRGRYWKDTPFHLDPEAFFKEMKKQGVRLFILGLEDRQNPSLIPLLRYLSCHAQEITDEFRERSGRSLDRKVFLLKAP